MTNLGVGSVGGVSLPAVGVGVRSVGLEGFELSLPAVGADRLEGFRCSREGRDGLGGSGSRRLGP